MNSPLNNLCAILLALFIPISIMFFASRLSRYLVIFVGVVLLIPMLIFSLFALLDMGSDDLELQNSLSIDLTTYRVYVHPEANAFIQPFTVVRKEVDTIFGVKFVRTIWKDDHYGKAFLRAINNSTIEVEFDGGFYRARLDV